MGQWENNVSAILNNYTNGRNNFRNMPNVALGGLVATELERQAERKRQLEVQKQKDTDAALERKLKLQEMQYKMDALNEAREQAKNNQALLTTLAPYQPRQGFDSETGENVTSGYSPLSPAFDALASASGLNLAGGDYSKVLDDTAKAVAAESQDPGKYAQLTDKERQKAIDDILAPYEFNYETRYMTPDVWKTIQNNDTRELLKQMQTEAQIYGANSRFQQSQERNASNERIAEGKNENKLRIEEKKGENQINKQNTINQGKKDIETEKNNRALMLKAIKEGRIKPRISNGKIAGYEEVGEYKPSLTPSERKEYEFYEREWLKRLKELELANENLDFDQLVELTTNQMTKIMKTLDKNKLALFSNVVQKEIKNIKAFDDLINSQNNPNINIEEILNDFNVPSLENPKGIQQILYSESGLK